MVIRIQHAFRRDELAYDDVVADRPAVGSRAVPELVFGFGKADVNADFAGLRAGQQELQSDRGLARAGASFEQVESVARESAPKNLIQPGDAGRRSRQERSRCVHRECCLGKRDKSTPPIAR